MPYHTPDTAPSDTVCRVIQIPNDPVWLALVDGALSELTKVWNWEEFGDLTPDEAAEQFSDIFWDYHGSECTVIPVGMIAPFADLNGAMPPKWLYCDNRLVLRASYPELFAVCGSQYGGNDGSTNFRLPDLRTRIPYGAASQSSVLVGQIGGEGTHVLTIPEMPSHTHVAQRANGTVGGSVARFSIATNPQANPNATTDATGGGLAHNNMPPFVYMCFGVYAGRL